jgi:signal transduction histidine kinase
MLPHWSNEGELLDQLEVLLSKTVKLESFYILTKSAQGTRFNLARAFPKSVEIPETSEATPALSYLRNPQVSHMAFNIAYAIPGQDREEQAINKLYAGLSAEFCFPLRVGEELLGLCFLGPKSGNDPYTRHDLILLVELFDSVGASLGQLRMRERLLLQEEMELMGRMSRGLAHDLNNLVTPVSTYLQLIQEQNGRADGLEELLPVALRNIQTIRAYIKEALMFSNTQSLQLTQTTLDGVVRDAAALAQAKLQPKNIRLELDLLTDVPVEIDSVLIQRVIDNLLSNAADASAPGSLITITLRQLARSEANREWYRIEVIDQGEGISKENLKRIFTPYFTTKDKGDKTRGFGLGLAICRKIVHLHGGNLSVRSELGKGTTVQIDLPSAQLAKPAALKPQEALA